MDSIPVSSTSNPTSPLQSKKALEDLSQGKIEESMSSGIGSMKSGLGAMEVMVKKEE